MMVHASRVESGKEVLYSSGTLRRSQAVVEQTIAPFLAARPDGRLVLGGHSYGSIVMQSVKTIVEKRYGPERIVAAYALSPVAHWLDPEVLVLIGDRDWMVPISDLLCRGEAVAGEIVNVPGLDHFAIQNSPDALAALRRHFYERAQPVKRAVDQEDGSTVDRGAW
jgi:pimeloyl-ACP methyl ester carboxylesterase